MQSTLCGFEDNGAVRGADLLVQSGPTLIVDIGFDAAYVLGTGSPDLGMKGVHALVDTGATTSCIDSDLAMALALPIVDQAQIAGVSGARTVNMHLAHIYVPTLKFTVYGQFAAVDLAAGGQSHSALIGRTFLRNFKMTYDGTTGQVMIGHPTAIALPLFVATP
jgi:gag-polyprotein putative aspartyl protease